MNTSIELKLDILDVDVLLSMLTKYANSTSHLGDKNDEFLCFGITDSINAELSKIHNIQTPAISEILKLKESSN